MLLFVSDDTNLDTKKSEMIPSTHWQHSIGKPKRQRQPLGWRPSQCTDEWLVASVCIQLHKMPNPRFDECAVMEQEAANAAAAAAKGLARGCCVASSRDCVCLKNTEFHSELVRPAGTRRYWFSRRVKRAGRKCSIRTRERWSAEMKRCARGTAACEDIKDEKKKKERESEEMWKMWKLYQCHQLLLFSCWHL